MWKRNYKIIKNLLIKNKRKIFWIFKKLFLIIIINDLTILQETLMQAFEGYHDDFFDEIDEIKKIQQNKDLIKIKIEVEPNELKPESEKNSSTFVAIVIVFTITLFIIKFINNN